MRLVEYEPGEADVKAAYGLVGFLEDFQVYLNTIGCEIREYRAPKGGAPAVFIRLRSCLEMAPLSVTIAEELKRRGLAIVESNIAVHLGLAVVSAIAMYSPASSDHYAMLVLEGRALWNLRAPS